MQRLIDFIEGYVSVSKEAKAFIEQHSIIIDYENGDYYMSPEDSKPYWNFVVKGLVENYIIDEKGNRKIKWFTMPNQLFLGTKNLYTKSNEKIFIKFARPAILLQISNERMKEGIKKFPELSELNLILKEQFGKRQKKHVEVLQTSGCTAQLKKFKKKFPILFGMLNPEQLAAHLNQGETTIYRALNEM